MATVQTAWDLFSTLEARKLPTVKGTDAQGVSYTIKLAAPLKGATYVWRTELSAQSFPNCRCMDLAA